MEFIHDCLTNTQLHWWVGRVPETNETVVELTLICGVCKKPFLFKEQFVRIVQDDRTRVQLPIESDTIN